MVRESDGKKRKRPSPEKIKEDDKKLRALRKKFAPRFHALGREMRDAAEKLVKLSDELTEEAVKVTGDPQFDLDHTVSFEQFGGSMEYQMQYKNFPDGPGFEDVYDLGEELMNDAKAIMEGAVDDREDGEVAP